MIVVSTFCRFFPPSITKNVTKYFVFLFTYLNMSGMKTASHENVIFSFFPSTNELCSVFWETYRKKLAKRTIGATSTFMNGSVRGPVRIRALALNRLQSPGHDEWSKKREYWTVPAIYSVSFRRNPLVRICKSSHLKMPDMILSFNISPG